MMEARDTILEEKGIGMWDWQPTIVGPCPHEQKCPIRFCAKGVKKKTFRVCKTSALYKSTFIERWARRAPVTTSVEDISYLIFARNEVVPDRAEKRKTALAAEEAAKQRARDGAQRDLYEASLSVKDKVFERLSEEALHRPSTALPPPVAPGAAVPAHHKHLLQPNVVKYVTAPSDKVNRVTHPVVIPPATHRFNRAAFVDAAYQLQRAITPREVLVVRNEMKDVRNHYAKQANDYWRIVLQRPRCHGRVDAFFCTTEGDLVKGKVYRRFYGDGTTKMGESSSSPMWQYIGGWRYLKKAEEGWLFPTEVPIYGIRKQAQVDFPNTLLNRGGLSVVEKTAMQHNAPMDPAAAPKTEAEIADDANPATSAEQRRMTGARYQDTMDGLAKTMGKDPAGASPVSQAFDTREPVSGHQWATAVRNARRNVKRGGKRRH
jgi:hypothetical protein